jgi:hypothetical protein
MGNIEHMTNDEAIGNISNLYNTDKMTLSNINITQNAKIAESLESKSLTTTAAVVNGQLSAKNFNVDTIDTGNINVANGATIGGKGRMHITGPELLYVLNKDGVIIGKEWGGNGNLTVQGNIGVGGIAGVPKQAITIIDDGTKIAWDQNQWVKYVSDNRLLDKSMPDGTMLPLFIVHAGDRNPGHPNRWMRLYFVIKYGNQSLFFQMPQSHDNIPNPRSTSSNDLAWRGNLQ